CPQQFSPRRDVEHIGPPAQPAQDHSVGIALDGITDLETAAKRITQLVHARLHLVKVIDKARRAILLRNSRQQVVHAVCSALLRFKLIKYEQRSITLAKLPCQLIDLWPQDALVQQLPQQKRTFQKLPATRLSSGFHCLQLHPRLLSGHSI